MLAEERERRVWVAFLAEEVLGGLLVFFFLVFFWGPFLVDLLGDFFLVDAERLRVVPVERERRRGARLALERLRLGGGDGEWLDEPEEALSSDELESSSPSDSHSSPPASAGPPSRVGEREPELSVDGESSLREELAADFPLFP